jgi:hypothetical protein
MNALYTVFQATVVAYALQPGGDIPTQQARKDWKCFSNRSTWLEYQPLSTPKLASIGDDADDRLFKNITCNTQHLVHPIVRPPCDKHYNLSDHVTPNLQLPVRMTALNDWKFITRMLNKNMNYNQASSKC